jgi:dynein light intermediate chain, axonemal
MCREWNEDGQLWVQYVSSTPATRLDVINLQEELDRKLQQRQVRFRFLCCTNRGHMFDFFSRVQLFLSYCVLSQYPSFPLKFAQARETGICPVREELYSQTFDELIRQVAINCSERGLLLLRVRDEIRMTISAYQTLYESSVAFGMRKALQAEQGKSDMEAKIKQLESEKKELERQVQDQKAKCEAIEKREAERRTLEEKKHNEEVAFLKRSHQQLKQQLESVLAPSAPAAKK